MISILAGGSSLHQHSAVAEKKGLPLALEKMEKSEDPFVRANLAIGLIGQRVEVQKASEVIYEILENEKETLLMWDQNSHMRILARSQVSHIDQIPNYPKVIDQMVRLDLSTSYASCSIPKLKKPSKDTLKTNRGGLLELRLRSSGRRR